MPLQTLAPDALLLQTSLTGTVADVDEDPDAADASFLLAPALQSAAAKTLYFMDTLQGAGYAMQDNDTAPATANFHGSTSGSGWTPGNTAVPRFGWMDYNTQVATNQLVATEPTATIINTANAGNYFRSQNAYTGSFAAGNWSIQLGIRGSAAADFNIRWHVWRSSDATGATNRTQVNTATIISATQTTTLTATLVNLAATWAAPAFSLTNEYLFFTPYINVTVSGSANQNVYLVKASTSRVLTTNFTAAEPTTRARVSFPTPTYSLTSGAGLQEFRCLVRRKGTVSPTAQLALYQNGALVSNLGSAVSVTSTTGQLISGTFDGSGRDMSQIEADVLGTGAVGGSVEVGAFEWNADTTIQQVDAAFLGDSTSLYGATVQKLAPDTDLRVSFPTPPDTLIPGADLQEFRVLVRKTSGTGTPQVRLELFYSGAIVSSGTLLPDTNVTSTVGEVKAVTFNATLLPDLTGQNVELRIYGTAVAGGATVEVGAVEWNVFGETKQLIAGYMGDATELFGARIHGDVTTVGAAYLGDATQLYGAQILGPVLAAGFIEAPLWPGAYPPGRWPPRSIASTHTLYGATISSGASGGYERVKPSVILAISGLSGVVADIDDDPDEPDQTFLQVS